MTRFLMMLMVAGTLTMPATAGATTGGAAGGDAGSALPGSVLAALASVRDVASLRFEGVAPDVLDARLAQSVTRLADALADLPEGDARAMAELVTLEAAVIGPELTARLREGDVAGAASLAEAFDALREAKARLAGARPHAGSEGPDLACFMNLANCYRYCSELDGWIMRSLCGLDCELDFSRCLDQALPSLPVKVPGRMRGTGDGLGTAGAP